PGYQYDEINRLTRLFNTTHQQATWFALWLQAQLDAVQARLAILLALNLTALFADRMRSSMAFGLKEPITPAERAARLEQARREPEVRVRAGSAAGQGGGGREQRERHAERWGGQGWAPGREPEEAGTAQEAGDAILDRIGARLASIHVDLLSLEELIASVTETF